MITCCVKGSSNDSGLNKHVSCNRLPYKKRKDKGDPWIKTINKSVLHKAGFPLADFFRTNGLFSPLIHHITQ